MKANVQPYRRRSYFHGWKRARLVREGPPYRASVLPRWTTRFGLFALVFQCGVVPRMNGWRRVRIGPRTYCCVILTIPAYPSLSPTF
ncbi:hypothetical protein FA13DRAFT_1150379 [Coprinellus micaceus]|uniref:Uncharacterized protein n=1 Tax=Coprinellus micaceus TaxID=71717 RepID=A0A4Y7SVK6_COPMI|nr:hypothetical protein FA13DRAFT_1150379 [Coprinellus micaceus]